MMLLLLRRRLANRSLLERIWSLDLPLFPCWLDMSYCFQTLAALLIAEILAPNPQGGLPAPCLKSVPNPHFFSIFISAELGFK